MKKKNLATRLKKSIPAYLLIFPLFAGLLVFAYFPAFDGLRLSFFQKEAGETVFCGFDNFKRLFADEIFLNSIGTMFVLMIPKLIIGVVVPFIFAEMLFSVKSEKLQSAYRILMLLPMLAPGVVTTLLWKAIYDPANGLMTALVKLFGIKAQSGVIDWLGDPDLVIFSIIFMGFPWIGGTNVLIYLAGLNGISSEAIESAKLEGTSVLQRIWKIDLPLLLGQIRYFLVFGIIGGLQDYSVQVILTGGGPGYSTYVPGYYMYHMAFMFNDKYYASTIGSILFIVILVITLIVNKATNKEVTE